MGYSTWHNYGYGICTDKMKVDSVERLEALLACAPQYRKSIHEWFEDCEITDPTVDDYWEFDEYERFGIATIMREVIQEAEGIEFLSTDDCDCRAYLVYPPSYPWNLRKEEANLTEQAIVQILSKYVNIVSDTELDIEYYSIENGG